MKGVIFDVPEKAVRREHPVDTGDGLLDAAELSGNYTSLGSDPDAETAKLVRATGALDLPADAVVGSFGRRRPLPRLRHPMRIGC